MSYHARKNIVTDGLVFSVDANNKLGGNTTDTRNIVKPTDVGTFVNGTSIVNGEFDFDGVDDYIDFGYISQLDLDLFTITLWFKNEIDTGNSGLIDKRGVGANDSTNGNFTIQTAQAFSGGDFLYSQFADSGFVDNWVQPANLSPNTYYSVTFLCDGSRIKLYRDDTLISDEPTNGKTPQYVGSQPLYFGRTGRSTGDRYFKGNIGSVCIYNRALTPTEITQNYEALKHRFE